MPQYDPLRDGHPKQSHAAQAAEAMVPEHMFTELCDYLGCSYDNEEALMAVKVLKDENERVRKALGFYADERRYNGSNQRPIPDDTYSPLGQAYIWNVDKDRGDIARKALESDDETCRYCGQRGDDICQDMPPVDTCEKAMSQTAPDAAELVRQVQAAVEALNSATATALKHGLRSLVTLGHGTSGERFVTIEVEHLKSWSGA